MSTWPTNPDGTYELPVIARTSEEFDYWQEVIDGVFGDDDESDDTEDQDDA